MRPKGTAEALESRRRDGLRRLRRGERVKEIAASLGVSPQAVYQWKWAAEEGGGLRALKAKPQHVPACRLSKTQLSELKRLLVKGAAAAGYATDLWTCARVAEVVQKKFRVAYHPGHLSRILHDLGFTPQKPARQARERDEEGACEFREKQWPAIKKGRKKAS